MVNSFKKVYTEWNKISTDEIRKLLIFVILRYCEMSGKKPIKPLKQLALLPREKLVKICHSLEKSFG